MKIQVMLQPVEYSPPAPFFVAHFFKYHPDDRCPLRILRELAFLVHHLRVEVAERCHVSARGRSRTVSAYPFHVHATVIVFELRLRAKNHEQKLLVRIIREALPEGADFKKQFLVHEIHNRAEITSVSRNAVGRPSEDAVEEALPMSR